MAEDYEELRVFDKEVKELTPEQKIEALIHTKKLDDTKNANLTTELATYKGELVGLLQALGCIQDIIERKCRSGDNWKHLHAKDVSTIWQIAKDNGAALKEASDD